MAQQNPQISGGFSDHILAWIEREFLDRLEDELHLVKLGKSKRLPQNFGQTVKWNRYTNIAASTTALSEAVSPDGINLVSTAVTATLAQYGQVVFISDFFDMTSVSDEMREVSALLAFAAGKSLDTIARDELDANGTQTFTDPTNNASIAAVEAGQDRITSSDLKRRLRDFRVNNVPAFADGNYRGVIHPLMEFDLLNESGTSDFVILASNTTNNAQEKGEIGVAYGIKLLRSTNIAADDTSTNTYANIFLGRDAFGTVDLQGAGLRMIMKGFDTGGTEDPLEQRASLGYKFTYAAKILETVRVQVLHAWNDGV